jgi:nitroreductase
MYHWPVIDAVATATVASSPKARSSQPETAHWPYPYLTPQGQAPAADVIRGRRSAQQFDRKYTMDAGRFFHLIDCLLPRPGIPWDVWRYPAHTHPLLFVHRVEGLAPGLYMLLRRPHLDGSLRSALSKEFLWREAEGAPNHLPLYQLVLGDLRQTSRTLNCHQHLGSDACFAVAMLTEFAEALSQDPWRYRQLHWEAGLLGQALYLEAEAVGLQGTGIGCFFDEAMHEALGLRDARYQSLYHFTVGRAIPDTRVNSLPPYPERVALKEVGNNDHGE